MFTALVLICANGIKGPDECFYQANQEFFETYQECKYAIKESVINYPDLFEFYDEDNNVQWKVTDWSCVNWDAMEV